MNSPELPNPSAKAPLIEFLSIASLLALAQYAKQPLVRFVRRYETQSESNT